jgi:hypothetical protein
VQISNAIHILNIFTDMWLNESVEVAGHFMLCRQLGLCSTHFEVPMYTLCVSDICRSKKIYWCIVSFQVLEMRLGDLTEQSSQNWFVSALGELFRVNLGAVRGGRVQIFGCVLLLGPARRAPLFRYTLMVS